MSQNWKQTGLDEVTYDLLVSRIAQEAKEKIDADAVKTRARITLLATAGFTLFIAALTGVATLALSALEGSIKDTTSAKIELAVPRAVRGALDDQLPLVRASLESAAKVAVDERVNQEILNAQIAWERITKRSRLREKVDEIQRSGGFNDPEMKSIIQDLKEIGTDKELRGSPEFASLLEKVIDQQAGAGRLDLTSQLVTEFGDIVSQTPGITWTLSLSYGRQMLSFGLDPLSLSEGKFKDEWDQVVENFYLYSDSARNNNVPEVPFVFDVVLSCMLNRSQAETHALLFRIDDFNDTQAAAAIEFARELVFEKWREPPDNETRIAKMRAEDCGKQLSFDGLSSRARSIVSTLR